MSRGGTVGTQMQGRFYPTAKAYKALGLPVPGALRASWWRRLLRRSA